MKQQNLNKWLNIKEDDKYINATFVNKDLFFNLDWESKSVSLTNEQIVGSTILTSLKLNKYIRINLGYIGQEVFSKGSNQFIQLENKDGKIYKNVPMMKSLLQKAIRRGEKEISIKAANHLIRMDLTAFLRRLPIIIVEDVELFREFNVVVWLMVVQSKSYKLEKCHLDYLLGLVYALSSSEKHFRHYSNNELLFCLDEIEKGFNKETAVALFIRKLYGGMDGDLNMLINIINKIRNDNINIPTLLTFPINMDSIKPLEIDEWILGAVDFHVCTIAKKIADKKNINENKVKQIIWNQSSRLNFRVKSHYDEFNELAVEWKKIEKSFNRMAKWWIDNLS